jgi:glycerophosphoryl diester phosphodiesterase
VAAISRQAGRTAQDPSGDQQPRRGRRPAGERGRELRRRATSGRRRSVTVPSSKLHSFVGKIRGSLRGHRGASGYLPEHTLESYALAIALGADFIEPDLVATKDGHLIARHEPNLVATTDVKDQPEFASRFHTAMVDGVPVEGWFASDFTPAEIKQLRAVQAFPERPQQFNGRFAIPTLEEIIALVKHKSRQTGRAIGIYPETKHPTYHTSIGLPLEDRLVQVLKAAGWHHRNSPVFIQSFEPGSLRLLRTLTRNRLIQLVDANDVNPDGTLDYTAPFDRPFDWTASGDPRLLDRTFAFFVTDEGLRKVREYADGIGPWKPCIVSSRKADLNEQRDGSVLGLLEDATVELEPGQLAVDEGLGRHFSSPKVSRISRPWRTPRSHTVRAG